MSTSDDDIGDLAERKLTVTVNALAWDSLVQAIQDKRTFVREQQDSLIKQPAKLADLDTDIVGLAEGLLEDWKRHNLVLHSTRDDDVTLYELSVGERAILGVVVAAETFDVITWEPDGEAVTLDLGIPLDVPNAESYE